MTASQKISGGAGGAASAAADDPAAPAHFPLAKPKPSDGPSRRAFSRPPVWAFALAMAVPLAATYLAVSPPSADIAAASYRSHLFAHAGLAIWDNNWYVGHSLPSYSLLSPALGAWLGVYLLLSLSALLGSAMYGVIAERFLPRSAAIASTLAFSFGFCCGLGSGRAPFYLGAAIALASLAALPRPGRVSAARPAVLVAALLLAAVASLASPVAGAFLALAALAQALASLLECRSPRPGSTSRHATSPGQISPSGQGSPSGRGSPSRPSARLRLSRGPLLGLALCACALAPILALQLAFPEGGFEPFAASSFWPQLVAAVAFAVLLPGRRSTSPPRAWTAVRLGAGLYALALVASFVLKTPMGGNAARLGEMVGPALVVGALWSIPTVGGRVALAVLAPLLAYWQLQAPVRDLSSAASDPAVSSSYYRPLLAELGRLGALSKPTRIEVPPTRNHWEARWLAGKVMLARGWERQLDERYAPIFYGYKPLTAASYERWLSRNAIFYVALPTTSLDYAGASEAKLIRSGLPYLQQVWRSRHWRLFAVRRPTPLAQPPAQLSALGPDSFTLMAPRAGSYVVRLHWTPYWALTDSQWSSPGCVARARGGFTEVEVRRAGPARVQADFSPGRALAKGPRCDGPAAAGGP